MIIRETPIPNLCLFTKQEKENTSSNFNMKHSGNAGGDHMDYQGC